VAGILESLHCVCEAHDIGSGAIEIELDGDQAMKAVADTWPLDPGNPDCNLHNTSAVRLGHCRLPLLFNGSLPIKTSSNPSLSCTVGSN
jgi:hypothetical protein